jgi:hypothetical protein
LAAFDALRLLRGADCLQAFNTERLQVLALLYLRTRFDQHYLGLLFCGLASTVCGYLWFKSGYIPKPLAAWGVARLHFAPCVLSFSLFLQTCEGREPVVLRCADGHFRSGDEFLASL